MSPEEIRDLAETTQALYAELVDQLLIARAETAAQHLPPPGSFVSKVVKGNRYWYLQRSEGGRKVQVYLGPESAALLQWIDGVQSSREATAPDRRRRRELVRMLASGGAAAPDAATGRVIQVLAERGLFRSGGVLVGTHAFACLGNLLGVALRGRSVRTADVDILHEPRITLALDVDAEPIELPEVLRKADPSFVSVPPFDHDEPSTSFKVRGRDLRVDFVTPTSEAEATVVRIPRLGLAARGLPHLDYLLDGTAQAAVVYDCGVLINVPEPARFAMHKLWLARTRPAQFGAKARKDRRQAAVLIAVLERDAPGRLEAAREALPGELEAVVGEELARVT